MYGRRIWGLDIHATCVAIMYNYNDNIVMFKLRLMK